MPSLLSVQWGDLARTGQLTGDAPWQHASWQGLWKPWHRAPLKGEESMLWRGEGLTICCAWPIDGQMGQNPGLLGSVILTCLPVNQSLVRGKLAGIVLIG